MKYFIYVLENDFGKYYIGHTNNIERRIAEHNGVSRHSWSVKYAPWKLVYSAHYPTRSAAMEEEKRLKSFKNKTSLAKFIEGSKVNIAG